MFPLLVVFIFAILVIFGISGSSVGIYDRTFNGMDHNDPNLLIGSPQQIRSDEWTVTTQMVIAQSAENYPGSNPNIGHGQNMNVILDVPSSDWSQIFRPQNWSFFVLPLENAFAFKWWFHSVILLLSAYFFVLFLLPKRYLWASLLAVIITFAGFLQWWYGSTLSMIAYLLLVALLYMIFINTKSTRTRIVASLGATYTLLCFALMLYPPFQIPCAFALVAFIVGYTMHKFSLKGFWSFLKSTWPFFIFIIGATLLVILVFFAQNKSTIDTVQNTTYPGKRIVESGGYSVSHILSGSLGSQFLKEPRANNYKDEAADALNQSESSTFIFISFFLLLPLAYVYLKDRKFFVKNKYIYLPIALMCGTALLLVWLFIPGLSLFGNITKLSTVPLNRAIMGLGLLNFLGLVTFVWIYSKSKFKITNIKAIIYSLAVFGVLVLIHLSIHYRMPGFIGGYLSVALAVPVPFVIYFLLRKYFAIALGILALFTLYIGLTVNPLYTGLDILTKNPISNYIQNSPDDGTYWIAEDIFLENIAIMSGRPSLSGVYTSPQVSIWESIDNGKEEFRYNRYAHVSFNLDKDTTVMNSTGFVKEAGPDQLVVKTEICSDFIKKSGVRHIVSSATYTTNDQSCISNIDKVKLENSSFFIYELKFD